MILLAAALVAGPICFFVSPTGSDTGAGTRSHPFRTLDHARGVVREYRHSHPQLNQNIDVVLTRGTYELPQTFVLTPDDSGTPTSVTVYRGENALISGGTRITGWTADAKGWWHVHLNAVADGSWNFDQLFVNGERRSRPRWPKVGYSNITEEVAPTESVKGYGYNRFGFKPGDIHSNWHNLSDVELLCFHIWDMSRMRVSSVNEASHVVTTIGPTGYDADWAKFSKGNRFIAENVQEALSDPGEWYLDQPTGDLTYIPMPGETPANATVVAPRIARLVDVEGSTSGHRYVEHVGFRDLKMSYTNWNAPFLGRFFPQAEVDLSAAIRAEGWRNGFLQKCTVSHVGEYGAEFLGGCSLDSVGTCTFEDLGAGGIKIGETRTYEDESDCANHISIVNSVIAHGGRMHPAAIGVWIGQSAYDTVRGCTISDLYYTGVSIGWTWGYGKSQAHDDVIEGNEISDIGQGVLSDMGGIYTLGIEPGTKLIANRIHDIDSFSYGGWGIYPDEGSSHELIEKNVVFRTKSGGFHQHYGEANTVRDNIFAFARDAEVIRTRAEDHLSFTFEHNIVYWKDAPLLGSNWSGNNYHLDRNLYWRTDAKPIDFAGMSLEKWQAKGQDVASHIVDPQFINPAKGDFRLSSSSSARLMGFTDSPAAAPTRTKLRPVKPAFPVH